MRKRGSRAFAFAALAVALSGCADDQAKEAQAQRDLAAAREDCARFAADAPAFDSCIKTELAVIANQRWRALEEQSPRYQLQPYGPRGVICVPSAAGKAVTC